jgi:hypothetical protein
MPTDEQYEELQRLIAGLTERIHKLEQRTYRSQPAVKEEAMANIKSSAKKNWDPAHRMRRRVYF